MITQSASQPAYEARLRQTEFLNSFGDFAVRHRFVIECFSRGKDKSRHDRATEIEHQAIRVSHYRHVTTLSAGGAEKAYDFIVPGFAGQLDHVFSRSAHIVIVDRRRDHDSSSG